MAFRLTVVFRVAFSPLPSLLAEDTARERPLGRVADMETVLSNNGGASLHETGAFEEQRCVVGFASACKLHIIIQDPGELISWLPRIEAYRTRYAVIELLQAYMHLGGL